MSRILILPLIILATLAALALVGTDLYAFSTEEGPSIAALIVTLLALVSLMPALASSTKVRDQALNKPLLRIRNLGLLVTILACARVSLGDPWGASLAVVALLAATIAWLHVTVEEDEHEGAPTPA